MYILLLSFFFLGLTLAAPIGPVNSARIDKGIKNGFWHAWIVGTGSMIADALFMILVYVGMVRFFRNSDRPDLSMAFWRICAYVFWGRKCFAC
ncbi:threonine/homoserine/homoserine lactone efflux protein [Peribacillus sp. V2I11]|nr:threonine/homoserine/homoserine lactone efflux protein [Peribacillus sp. V2I11]